MSYIKSNLYYSIFFCRKLWGISFLVVVGINTHLKRFFRLGSSAKIAGQNRELVSWHLTTTRAPTYSCSSFGVLSKAMWWPDTRLLPFSSKLTLYFNRPSSANTKMSMREIGKILIVKQTQRFQNFKSIEKLRQAVNPHISGAGASKCLAFVLGKELQ